MGIRRVCPFGRSRSLPGKRRGRARSVRFELCRLVLRRSSRCEGSALLMVWDGVCSVAKYDSFLRPCKKREAEMSLCPTSGYAQDQLGSARGAETSRSGSTIYAMPLSGHQLQVGAPRDRPTYLGVQQCVQPLFFPRYSHQLHRPIIQLPSIFHPTPFFPLPTLLSSLFTQVPTCNAIAQRELFPSRTASDRPEAPHTQVMRAPFTAPQSPHCPTHLEQKVRPSRTKRKRSAPPRNNRYKGVLCTRRITFHGEGYVRSNCTITPQYFQSSGDALFSNTSVHIAMMIALQTECKLWTELVSGALSPPYASEFPALQLLLSIWIHYPPKPQKISTLDLAQIAHTFCSLQGNAHKLCSELYFTDALVHLMLYVYPSFQQGIFKGHHPFVRIPQGWQLERSWERVSPGWERLLKDREETIKEDSDRFIQVKKLVIEGDEPVLSADLFNLVVILTQICGRHARHTRQESFAKIPTLDIVEMAIRQKRGLPPDQMREMAAKAGVPGDIVQAIVTYIRNMMDSMRPRSDCTPLQMAAKAGVPGDIVQAIVTYIQNMMDSMRPRSDCTPLQRKSSSKPTGSRQLWRPYEDEAVVHREEEPSD